MPTPQHETRKREDDQAAGAGPSPELSAECGALVLVGVQRDLEDQGKAVEGQGKAVETQAKGSGNARERQWKHMRKAVFYLDQQVPAERLEVRKERNCLRYESSGNTRQRWRLSHEGSGTHRAKAASSPTLPGPSPGPGPAG